MASKVCPLCGRTYGLTMSLCPVDGRMLVESHEGAVGSAGPIRLSQATEALLGNILDAGAQAQPAASLADVARAPQPPQSQRRRHEDGCDGDDHGATLVGPPPGMAPRHVVASSGVTETTVSSAFSGFREVTLSKPLASLAPVASLPPAPESAADNAVTHPRMPRVERTQRPPDEAAARADGEAARRRDVFGDLQLEFGVLAAEVTDDAVTRRVARSHEPLDSGILPPSAASLGDRMGASDVSVELGADLVDSEDTTVGPSREEVREMVRRRNHETTAAIDRRQLDRQADDAGARIWWILAIVVLSGLAGVVWFMALR